jgi:hypothetical protein
MVRGGRDRQDRSRLAQDGARACADEVTVGWATLGEHFQKLWR